jgi:hypothetical protein
MTGQDRAAVLIPGSRPGSPLLAYASVAVRRCGGSAAVLSQVMTAVEQFLDQLWP